MTEKFIEWAYFMYAKWPYLWQCYRQRHKIINQRHTIRKYAGNQIMELPFSEMITRLNTALSDLNKEITGTLAAKNFKALRDFKQDRMIRMMDRNVKHQFGKMNWRQKREWDSLMLQWKDL